MYSQDRIDHGGSGSLPAGVTQAQLDAVKRFNAGLTQAGTRSRLSHARGSSANRQPRRDIVRRGGPTLNVPQSGSGRGYGLSSYTLGATTPAPTFKPQIFPRYQRNAVVNFTTGGTSSQAGYRNARYHEDISHAVDSIIRPGSQTGSENPFVIQPNQPGQHLQNSQNTLPTPYDQNTATSRELIVTNMTENDPLKPWIPSHLQQSSAYEAILQIHQETGLPMNVLTSDSYSIPGSSAPPSSGETLIPALPITLPSDVDPNDPKFWKDSIVKMTTVAKLKNTSNNHVGGLQGRLAGNLAGSVWATPSNASTSTAGLSTSGSSVQCSNYACFNPVPKMDVDMGGVSDCPPAHVEGVLRDNFDEMSLDKSRLADSRWAPKTNDSQQAGARLYTAPSAENWNHSPATLIQKQSGSSASVPNIQPGNAYYSSMSLPEPVDQKYHSARNLMDSPLSPIINSTLILPQTAAPIKPSDKEQYLKDSRWA